MNKLLDEMSGIGSNAVQDKFHVPTPMAKTVGGGGKGGEAREPKAEKRGGGGG